MSDDAVMTQGIFRKIHDNVMHAAERMIDPKTPPEVKERCLDHLLDFVFEISSSETDSDVKFAQLTTAAQLCFSMGRPLPEWVAHPLVVPLINHANLESLSLAEDGFGLKKRTPVRLKGARERKERDRELVDEISRRQESGQKITSIYHDLEVELERSYSNIQNAWLRSVPARISASRKEASEENT